MDPLSITAGVLAILGAVSKLNTTVTQFQQDYRFADQDLNIARSQALLLKEEIRGLDSARSINYTAPRKASGAHNGFDGSAKTNQLVVDESTFAKAMSTARDLLSDIEASFPLRSEPHTWKSKAKWALRDKQVLAQLKERLQSAESTLQGIVSMEQLRVNQMMYGILINQQSTMAKLESGEILSSNTFNMTVINQTSSKSTPAVLQAQLSEIEPERKQSKQPITKPSKLLPASTEFQFGGFSARLVTLPKDEGTSYRGAVHISLFGRVYSVQLHISTPNLFSTLDYMLHVRNVIPTDSEMAIACRAGDFDSARKLLTSGSACGSDITASGWPVLDYAVESGSARLVRLLLEHGANPDMAYGEHNMTALQSSFLRGRLDIARMLLSRGADIEHVDSDGYSVLSYLWVVDKRPDIAIDFMRLCLAGGFSEVNACDDRGWTAFHRAAAVGTPEDVEAFLRLGASLDLRAEWYGWTALFFAASHDNVETFRTIVKHSGPDVYESLDGDGWSLLHCCTYFGAQRVTRLVLENGVDVNQKSHPAPLPEDPELSYKELTASDIALYIGPDRYQMFLEALTETGRDVDLEGNEVFWDAADSRAGQGSDAGYIDSEEKHTPGPIYGAEDVDDMWTTLHWASYNGSPKIKRLFLMKGADPEHLDAITLDNNQTVLPVSPFDGR